MQFRNKKEKVKITSTNNSYNALEGSVISFEVQENSEDVGGGGAIKSF